MSATTEETPPDPDIPFTGRLTFDLTFVLLGKAAVRKLRIDYGYRPDWDYFDSGLEQVVTGGPEERQTTLWLLVPPDDSEAEISYLSDAHGRRIEPSDPSATARTWQDWDEPRWIRADTLNELQVLPFEMWNLIDAAIDRKCRSEDEQRRIKTAEGPPKKPRKRAKRRRKVVKKAARATVH